MHWNKKFCVVQTITILNRRGFSSSIQLNVESKSQAFAYFIAFISIKHISNEVEVIIKSIAVHALAQMPFSTWKSECQAHLRAHYVPYQIVFIGHDGSTHNYKFKLIVSIEFEFYRIIPKMGRCFFPMLFHWLFRIRVGLFLFVWCNMKWKTMNCNAHTGLSSGVERVSCKDCWLHFPRYFTILHAM